MSPSTRRTWCTTMPVFVFAILSFVSIWGGIALWTRLQWRFPRLAVVVAVLLIMVAMLYILHLYKVHTWSLAERRRKDREHNGECLRCGYSLKRIPEPKRCPECGSSIDPDTSPQR